MWSLLLAGVLAAPPAVTPAPPAVTPAPPRPVSPAECTALAEHGFELYLSNLKNDEGIQYEMRDLSREDAVAYLKEVRQNLKQDRSRYIADASARCRERVESGQGSRKQYDCAMAAKTFPGIEKCLGIKLGGEAPR